MLRHNMDVILECDEINNKMLKLIHGNITGLNVQDDVECEKYLKQRDLKKLKSFEENNSRTAE